MSNKIIPGRRRFFRTMAIAAAAAPLAVAGLWASLMERAALQLSTEGKMPAFDGATGWLNSQPLTPAGLRGKVVLINFWTYTCINWLRTLPHIRAWHEKYQDQGLVVIGVHTPEFPFERDTANVQRLARAMKIEYPIATDNDYAIWRAFNNQYWPALYIVDAQGRIRHHEFGEGNYDQSEQIIQHLLREAGASDIRDALVSVDAHGVEAPADWENLKSAENYVGHERAGNFASPSRVTLDKPRIYTVPAKLPLNHWALSGDWTIGRMAALSDDAGGRIAYCFHARDLHLVMGPSAPDTSIRVRVGLDGQPPGASHGVDIDSQGNGTVNEQRLYQLVRQTGSIVDRQFEIEFLDPGVEAFAFTFG